MLWWRRLRMFMQDHRLGIGITLFVGACLILTVYGMSELEEMSRDAEIRMLNAE